MIKTVSMTAVLLFFASVAAGFAAPEDAGDQLFAAGEFSAAKSAYAATLAQHPNDSAANAGLARVALYENHLDEARAAAERALRLDSQNATAKSTLARIAQRLQVREEAARITIPGGIATVPFLATDPLPLLRVKINGRSANVLLDTGAPDIALDPDFAAELHLKTRAAGTGTFAGNRKMQVRETTVDRVELGGVTVRDLTAGVIPSRGLPFFADRHLRVDGIVGTIFLSRFLSTIDYPNARLVLRPRSQLAQVSGATAVPFWYVGDHMLFAQGSVNGGDGLFLVDSGLAGGGFMPTEATIASAHVKTFPDRAQEGMGGAGPVKIIPILADRLCLGSACQSNIPGAYTPGGDPLSIFPFGAAGGVSHEFLKHYALTLDFEAMRILLSAP